MVSILTIFAPAYFRRLFKCEAGDISSLGSPKQMPLMFERVDIIIKMDLSIKTESGVVNFENVNLIKKKAVRGLLRKRAKQYDSASDSEDSDVDTSQVHIKKKVQKSSMADAFRSIMSKKISEAPIDTPAASTVSDATLTKYKKKTREADEKIAKEEAELKKRQKKE